MQEKSGRRGVREREREKTAPGIALTWVLDCAIQPPELCVPSGIVHRVSRTPSVEKAREQAAGRQTAAERGKNAESNEQGGVEVKVGSRKQEASRARTLRLRAG